MKSSIGIIVSIVLLNAFFSSCSYLSPPSIEDTWRVEKIELTPNDHLSESIYAEAYLSFYDDGKISFYNKKQRNASIGVYRIGKWSRKENALQIKLDETPIEQGFQVIEVGDRWLVIQIANGRNELIGTKLKCVRTDLYKEGEFDLLKPEFNRWRIAPDKKENADEIKARVVNHVDFLLGYFKMLEEKSQNYFEPSVLHTPFNFYSNGIGLGEYFESDNRWLSNFYDQQDAVAGANLLRQGIRSIDKYPADEGSYGKGYYNALMLIKDYIEK